MNTALSETPEEILAFFAEAHNFIDDAVNNGGSVLIHCIAGAHRAGTCGVSYMMKAGKLDYEQALRLAKKIRPVIDPMG